MISKVNIRDSHWRTTYFKRCQHSRGHHHVQIIGSFKYPPIGPPRLLLLPYSLHVLLMFVHIADSACSNSLHIHIPPSESKRSFNWKGIFKDNHQVKPFPFWDSDHTFPLVVAIPTSSWLTRYQESWAAMGRRQRAVVLLKNKRWKR